MSREENIELVRAGYEAFNRRDFEAALELGDDSITWRPYFSVETPLLVGKDAVLAAWKNQAETLDLRIELGEVTAIDETRVLAVANWIAHGAGSGARVEQTAAQLFTVVDGKIRNVETYASEEEALATIPRLMSPIHDELNAPVPPPEVEQAALLGHIDDAVSLYLKFTDVDPETARQVVEKLAEG